MIDAVLTSFVVAALFIGALVGGEIRERQCADSEVSDDPPAWWTKSKIMAQARKDANKVQEDA
jgi:hypothetical protein